MTELLTAAQMRAIEQAAIASGEVTGLELMERAGRGVVEAVFEEWPELAAAPHRAVVLCGPGNNGGDGFVVARLLKEWGWAVEVYLYGDPERLPPDAKANYGRWKGMGEVAELPLKGERDWREDFGDADLIVDAIFGIGLTRPFPSNTMLWGGLNNRFGIGQRAKIVAIDTPSRLCADSGRILDEGHLSHSAPTAHLVVTFHEAKAGHYLAYGPNACVRLKVCDIGLSGAPPATEAIRLLDREQGWLSKFWWCHKYDHGHALILSGGAGRTGAARLAARGALRIGAGLVTLGVPGAAQLEVAAQVTAVMLARVTDGEGLAEVLEDRRINALCLGPGLGVERAAGLVAVALGRGGVEPRPTVLDADALTALAGDASLFAALHESCVLTPHGGEFARLFPDIAEKLAARPERGPAYSKVDATREAAARAGCVVLFKGPDTVIAAPDGRCSVNSAHYGRAVPWLATAGAGDVLAGFIAGLLARGLGPMRAAETGAWLHVECALFRAGG